jgi:hypothetical protein
MYLSYQLYWKLIQENFSPSQTRQKEGSYLKNNQRKKAGGVAQVVVHLLSKHKALNSNPSAVKNKNQ